jgi:hypothetical protein
LAGSQKGTRIEILYYPTDYTMVKSVSYEEPTALLLEAPYIKYIGGKAGSLTIVLFYDTYEHRKDVRYYTDQVLDLMKIDPEIHSPPPLKFIWGLEKQAPFICVLESVTKKFTMFLPEGIPVRASLTLTLKEYKMGLNKREKTLQSPDKTKVLVTQRGDSLWVIASRVYGNAGLWRPIADRNGIKNPRFLEPGIELIIPPLE